MWYQVKCVFRISYLTGKQEDELEEQIRIVKAANPQEAYEITLHVTRTEEEIITTQQGGLIQWALEEITGIHKIQELKNGGLLYSRPITNEQMNTYLFGVKASAQQLQEELRRHSVR